MLVYEYRCKLRLKKTLSYERLSEPLSYFLDSALGKQPEFLQLHESMEYKYYCFDLLYPSEKDKMYKSGNVYTFRIRTVKPELAEYFSETLPYHESNEFFGLNGELRIIKRKIIENVYTLTPAIMKNDFGYWKKHMTLLQFEERLKANLIKKYNEFMGEKIDEEFQLYDLMEFKNTMPIKTYYKGICLLGDKLNFVTSKNKRAQELWYFALGTGILENNSRSAGFLNFRYL